MPGVITLVYYYKEHMPLWQMSHDQIGIFLHESEPNSERAGLGQEVSLNELFHPLGLSVKTIAETLDRNGAFIPLHGNLDDTQWTSEFLGLWIYETQDSAQILANLLNMNVYMFSLEQSSPEKTPPKPSHRAIPNTP